MPFSHTTAMFAVKTAKVRKLLTDPAPTVLAITGATNAGTTVTAAVASSAALSPGQVINVSGITGFTTNNPNGNGLSVASVPDGTHFTYVVPLAPTGAYASGGSVQAINPATYGPSIEI